MHTGKSFSKRHFGKLRNSQICGSKLHKRLSLRKDAVDDDKIWKESSIKVV